MKLSRTLAVALTALCGTVVVTGCDKRPAEEAHAPEPFKRMTVDELDGRIAQAREGKAKLLVVDNNGEGRYQQGHIPGAKWVKYSDVKAEDLPADKDTTLVFYCANEH